MHDVTRNQGCAIVLVSNDERIEDIADCILWLEDGAIRGRKAEQHSWVRDPVCGMRVDAGTATLTADHGGHQFTFRSRRCFEHFEAEPDRYALLFEQWRAQKRTSSGLIVQSKKS